MNKERKNLSLQQTYYFGSLEGGSVEYHGWMMMMMVVDGDGARWVEWIRHLTVVL
jgi:hypothetical protein